METAAPSNEEPINASTGVAFALDPDVEANRRSSGGRRSSTDEMKHRESLTKSGKAWDIDGDGELDETELALKELDGDRRGTLTKEQMYKIMHDNIEKQRELFKTKKIVAV